MVLQSNGFDPSVEYAVLTSKHHLQTKRLPAASKSLAFLVKQNPSLLKAEKFAAEKKLIELSQDLFWVVNDFE